MLAFLFHGNVSGAVLPLPVFIVLSFVIWQNISGDNKKILCDIVGADTIRPCKIILSNYGIIVEDAIKNIPNIYENISVPKYVIIPNHIHIILQITNNGGRMVSAPTVIAGMKRYVSKKCGITI